ncbi:mandelate racemase/muconate lactonizing enzyme family protein [Paralimibaculum aggregatum]|uniref:Mandelate racemase/muconate lactonizing enzyme family protein n=1 Tax=Paralimibaculum aggregatum TaxID=3036245 RepID=A0ABQ6LPW0_9RHOB|nr:mandelate racemase/muconate lactonizing enzyme family protein [Limibaculum sp. NKW23]GMG82450.1 mandelate racemase/muconate lactonizing enzyme family protein [Limibaculum sp. NKW23]
MDNRNAEPVRIARLDVHVFRVPITVPVITSFGTMRDRPAVFLRIEDTDSAFGWGEIFANWPAAGAEHRGRLLMEDVADLLLGETLAAPGEAMQTLTARTEIRALQCGEWGPFRQVIAGIDIAMHDLFARRAGVPVSALLAEAPADAVPAYASGIDIASWARGLEAARAAGFRAFKFKVGFDLERDLALLRDVHGALGEGERICVDANQAWQPAEAAAFSQAAAEIPLVWIEEPIRADMRRSAWKALAADVGHPLAGGENIAGFDDFAAAIDDGALQVIQPDIAKWGGLSGCLAVARQALEAGRMFCPHFLGGGIGLRGSAHLLAAAGGPGLLEVDINHNPLRDLTGPLSARMRDGCWQLDSDPGLGLEELPGAIARYQTAAASRSI